MFVRVRQSASRLQLSLVETCRDGGRVRHEHVAGLGSIRLPPSPADRIEFWTRLHQRLAKLGNRIDAATHGKIMASVHDRIPMPTPDDQRAVQLQNAKADAKFWDTMHDMHAGTVAGQKELIAKIARDVAAGEPAAATAAARAEAARDRLARIERGEDVPGLGKPLTAKAVREILTAAGWTASDIRDARYMAEIGEEGLDEVVKESVKRSRLADKAATRAVLKQVRQRRRARDHAL